MAFIRYLPIIVCSVVLGLVATGCGDDEDSTPRLDDPSATGMELVDEYFTYLVDGDEQGLDELLSDAFTVQRADGSTATKDEYLAELPELKDFEIGDISAKQDGPALVVRYDQTVEAEQIGGTRFQGGPAPRLSTFVWQDGDWHLTSHANFNVPTGP